MQVLCTALSFAPVVELFAVLFDVVVECYNEFPFRVSVPYLLSYIVFNERELTFTFAICCRPSIVCLSVTLVRPTQAVEIFGNISTQFGTLAIH